MTVKSWKRIGRVFTSEGQFPWMHTHAAVPIAEHLSEDIFKIYFSSRDQSNRSYTGFVVIDLQNPDEVLELSSHPVLSPGALGTFDDSGAMGSWLLSDGNKRYLYYIGWNLGVTVPFRNSIGLAVSENGEPFRRVGEGPILDRTLAEPHFCASCAVIKEAGLFKMWYLSCLGWCGDKPQPQHRYHIKYADSVDGIVFDRSGVIAVDLEGPDEFAISRPSIIRDEGKLKMWYSYRGPYYRIGYAESVDGGPFIRRDHFLGLDVSGSGWDSDMVEYPYVFSHQGQLFMLYNGNGYGLSGFGLATLSS